ncbi:MAG: carboxypeptidase regulatory-like domain-containing protein [Candidatus Sumerlaeota bacterium]|nr:carboxypeptidase regulatory-like domain-containing protein [Candidatus Sumerlaeota bacterium]
MDSGEGVAGASVTLREISYPSSGKSITAGVTDANGVVLLAAPAAKNVTQIEARHPQIATVKRYVRYPASSEVVLKVERGVSIFGKVFLEDRSPAAGALVKPGRYEDNVTTADANGAYELTGLNGEAYYQVTASLGALISNSGRVEARYIKAAKSGRTGPYDLILKPGLEISGIVLDRTNGKPVAGAEIQPYDYRLVSAGVRQSVTVSSADGAWRMKGLPEGIAAIRISAKGYAAQSASFQTRAGAKNQLELMLEPGADILVKVVSASGAPVAGADVQVFSSAGPAADGLKNPTTDAQGQVRIESVSARNPPAIRAMKDRMWSDTGNPIFAKGSRSAELTLRMVSEDKEASDNSTTQEEKVLAFRGRVTAAGGAAIAGAKVKWEGYDGYSNDSAIADKEGAYRLEIRMSSDEWQIFQANRRQVVIAVSAPGYVSANKIPFEGGMGAEMKEPREVNATLEKGRWAGGLVVNGKGEPLADIAVSVEPDEGNQSSRNMSPYGYLGRSLTYTGPDGKFRLEDLPNRKVLASVSGKGWTTESKKELALDQETRIVMRESGRISGRVIAVETGAPVRSFTVQWGAAAGRQQYQSVESGTDVCADDGAFALYDLNQGQKYTVKVLADGFAATTLKEATAAAESEIKPVEIKLSKSMELRGTVFDSATQKPVAGAEVALYEDASRIYYYQQMGDAPRTRTEADGGFSLEEAASTSIISVKAEGYALLRITPDQRAQYFGAGQALRIGLKRGARVLGVVTLNGKPLPGAQITRYFMGNDRDYEDQMMNRSIVTDADGKYLAGGLKAGQYQLSASKQVNGVSISRNSRITVTENEDKTINIAFETSTSALSGRVLSGQTPMPRAMISVQTSEGEDSYSFHVNANANGEYRIEGLKDGKYSVQIYDQQNGGYGNNSEKAEVKGDTKRDFVLPEKHVVRARLVFEGAEAPKASDVRAAYLSIKTYTRELSQNRIDHDATCGAPQGFALAFTGRLKGEYLLTVQAVTAGSNDAMLSPNSPVIIDNLNGDQDLGEIHIPPADASLKGHIFNLNHKPVANADISLTADIRTNNYHIGAKTDADGAFTIKNLKAGGYSANIAFRDSPIASEKVWISGAMDRDFTVAIQCNVIIKLALPEKGARYSLSDFPKASLSRVNPLNADTQTGASPALAGGEADVVSGEITIKGYFQGQYLLTLGDGHEKSLMLPQPLTLNNADQDQVLDTVRLPEMGTARIRMAMADAAAPKPRFCMALLIAENTTAGAAAGTAANATTGAAAGAAAGASGNPAGRLLFTLDKNKPEQEIGPLPAGAYQAHLCADSWKATPDKAPVTVKGGEAASVSFTLSPRGALGGMIQIPLGASSAVTASRITLTGPDGQRSVAPLDAQSRKTGDIMEKSEYLSGALYSFSDLSEGAWHLKAEAEGCEPFEKDCVVKIGETRDVQIRFVAKK